MAKNIFWVICLCGAVIGVWHASAPVFANGFTVQELGIIRDDIERLESNISRWRSEATKIEDRAERYEQMADDAKNQIKQSINQADKDHLQDTVNQRLQRAKTLRADAVKLLKKAKSKDIEVSALKKKLKNQEKISGREQAEKNIKPNKKIKTAFSLPEEKKGDSKRFPIDVLVGAWESKGDKDLFVIVPQNPNDDLYAGRMEAHTENRVWEGRYHPEGEIDAPAMMTFTYKPKAAEINKDIPKWARQQIEGELEWALELHQAGTWGTPRFQAKFFPGKVEWDEKALVKGGKNAWVTGKGKPRNIDYNKIYGDVYSQTYGAPEIFIRMPGETDPQKNHVEAIIKIQPFFIDVVLPADLAKEQGKFLTVDVENIDAGDKTTLDLKAGVSRKNHSVHYTHDKSILLARFSDTRVDEYKAPTFSWNRITGNTSPGKRLDLSIEDGQSVAFKFKGAEASAPFYNSWFQRGIARHVEAIPKMRAMNAHIAGNTTALYHPDVREEATRKLTMIKNYENIVLNADLHDRELYAVGEKYFGLKGSDTGLIDLSRAQIKQLTHMNRSSYLAPYMRGGMEKVEDDEKDKKKPKPKEKIRNGLTAKTRDGNNEGHAAFKNVVWTSEYERGLIRSAVDLAEKEAREDAVKELPLAIAYAMYTGIASASNADAAYLWIFGEDLQGKKASYGERLGGAASLFLGQLVSMKMPTMMTMPNTNIKTVGIPKRLSAKSARIGRRAHFKEQMKLKQNAALRKLDKKLKSISDGQLNHIISDANLPIGPSGKIRDWKTPRKNIASKKVKKFEDLNTALPPPRGAPPPTPSLDDVKATFKKNQHKAIEASAKKSYGDSVKTSEPHLDPQETNMCNCRQADPAFKKYLKRTFTDKELFKIMVEYDIIHPPMSSPLEFGVSDLQVMQLMHKMGFEVKHIPSQKAVPPEVMDQFLKAGWHVRDVIKPKGQIGEKFTHAVQVENFNRNAKGEIEEIEFYDSGYGANQTMPYEDYKKIAEDGYGLILYRWPENGKPPAAIKGLDTVAAKAPPRARKLPERLDLDEALKRLYPNNDYPPLHITQLKDSNDIINDGQLDLSDQGASFSQGGAVGIARDGDFAIRVKPESLVTNENPNGSVELYDEALGKGKRSTFWPDGKSAGGKGYSSHIPTEHLQFLDTSTNKWRNFQRPGVKAPAHNASDLNKANNLDDLLKEFNAPPKIEAVESLDDFEVD